MGMPGGWVGGGGGGAKATPSQIFDKQLLLYYILWKHYAVTSILDTELSVVCIEYT